MAGVLLLCGCSAPHRGRAAPPRQGTPPPPAAPVDELSYAVAAPPPTNWNILAAGVDQQALAPVADQVWPSVFTFGPDFNPVLNTSLVVSASPTAGSPQTILYKINPRATWSDGTPVTGSDFVYNWQAQSGSGSASDVGGRPFTASTSSAYAAVRSVTVSPASTDDVTVVLSGPDPDWTALFRHLIPAHIAQHVGFDSGFTDPVSDLVSDGPYLVASYDRSGVVHLVRNPSYTGPPAAALELDVHYLPDTPQLVAAMSAGQISCAEVPEDPADVAAVRASPNVAVSVGQAAWYVDLLFNAATGPMSSADSRAAVVRAISASAAVPTALKGVDPQPSAVGNRFLVPGEAGYTANPVPPSPGGERQSPPTTAPVSLRLVVASADPVATTASQAVAGQLGTAGYAVTTAPVGDLSKAAPASWDLAVVVRQLTPWPFQAITAYKSGQPSNLGRISDAGLDTAVEAALAAPLSQQKATVDQVDVAAWNAYADYPLASLSEVLACQTDVTGAAPNPSPDGPAYDAAGWGLRGS